MVEAVGDGIIFQPAETIDLVRLARPRYSMASATQPYDGLPVDTSGGWGTIRFGATSTDTAYEIRDAFRLQGLTVTPGCLVRIEPIVALRSRIDVSRSSLGTTPCEVYVEVLRGSAARLDIALREGLQRQIEDYALSLEVRPLGAVQLRRFGVTGLAFTTNEGDTLASSMRGGTLRFPDDGNRADTVYYRDSLTLGALSGEIVSATLGESIRVVFRGRAAAPKIGSRDLRPVMLVHLAYREEARLVLVLLAGVAAVLVPFLVERSKR